MAYAFWVGGSMNADPRGLDRALFQKLTDSQWIDAHVIWHWSVRLASGKVGWHWRSDTRPAATIAPCSITASRSFFEDLALARGDGRHPRLLRNLGRADLLILDDWGLEPFDAAARHDLLEILEERYGRRSTAITSQLPSDRRHEIIGDPHIRGRDPGPPRSQCSPHRTHRRKHATAPRQPEPEGLTTASPMPEIHRPERLATRAASFRNGWAASSRRIPGGIIPLHPGGFVGIRTMNSKRAPITP